VVADIDITPNPATVAERLRDAIATIPFEITASIGTSGAPITVGPVTPVMQLIDDLINSSDTAMYQAKRAGGNQVCHSGVAPPLA
jgi:GGDEF domain-containing protein